MILRNRALFVLLGCVTIASASCSGGGGGGGNGGGGTPATPTPSPTPVIGTTPTPTPVATATATPAPTGTPTKAPTATPTPGITATPIAAGTVTSRPLTTGDTFTYAGHSLQSFVYYGSSPDPSATIAAVVSQSVTNKGPVSFGGGDPYDLATTESDASPNQTIGLSTDTYFANLAYGASQTGFYTYGYKSKDTNGQTITDTIASDGNGNGLLDILPETAGASWTNTGSQTFAESESDGFTSTRRVAADGTYTEADVYPQGTQASLTGSITENGDGSGTYRIPLFGAQDDNATFTYSAPSAGKITITYSQPDGGSTDTESYTVTPWYALPLYAETDQDRGSLALPASCAVPTAFGTKGNGIEQKFTKIDTVIGTRETFDQITYVVGGYSVCTTLADTTQIFYDYSGQGDELPFGISFNGGTTPLEVETISSALGLTDTNVTTAARLRDHVDAASSNAAFGVRAALVRSNFLAMVERRRLERLHRAALHVRKLHLRKAHR